jgi:hypothetical protein
MKNNKNFFTSEIRLLIFLLFLFQLKQSVGQILVEEEDKRLYYDRTVRITNFWEMKDMRDVFHKNKYLLGKKRISGNISSNVGRILINDGRDGQKVSYEVRNALGFYTRIRFFEEFSLNSTFYVDFNPKASAQWTSNYTYSIGRYNWRSNKFNYGYENYINNRYTDDSQTRWDKFLEGYYFISYNRNLSQDRLNKIKLDETTDLKFTYFARYAIKYIDQYNVLHGNITSGKTTLGAGFRYTIYKRIYVEAAVYYYPEGKLKKQGWDPDYTYGFGYFEWRSFRVSLTYGNWAVNRFPWNETAYPHYGFLDGNFRVIANWSW